VVTQRGLQRVTTTRVRGIGPTREERLGHDDVIVEEPMWILLDGELVATTMRTPGADLELAAGFCFTEGLLTGGSLRGVDHATGGYDVNTVAVETTVGPGPVAPRLGSISSSCGWCGSAQIDELCSRLDPLPASAPIGLDVLASVPGRVVERQQLFAATGAVHGAAVFDAGGEVTIVREDVGRHNAVDKVVGALLLGEDRLPATGLGLFVSGRASVEMVQKAWAAGFGTLLAMSAPTALAVDAATRAGMQLVGFVRDDGFNVYTPPAGDV
jgi:FdhD protein